ncbi:MAG: glycosyltransferase family 9 protein [Phycisphaerales bacterium]
MSGLSILANQPPPKRMLIIRPSALGDVCRTVPVLASLRAAFPDATIDWVVQDTFVDAVRGHPSLDEVIPFPRDGLSGWWRSPGGIKQLRQWMRSLTARNYDVVFDLQGLFRSGWMAKASGAAQRFGSRDAREGAWLFYRPCLPRAESVHIVDRMLELLQHAGIPTVADMRLTVPADCQDAWQERSQATLIQQHNTAILAPTSRWSSKRWPIERWAQLIDPLHRSGYERIVIIGGPGEDAQLAPLRAAVEGRADVIDLAGQLSIGESMALVRDAHLLIANDSAPLHMAVGLGTRVIALFGPTDPRFVGPYGCDDAVIQSQSAREVEHAHFRKHPEDDALMRAIAVDDVVAQLR